MTIKEEALRRLDNLTKPKGSLGDLESFAVKLAEIQKNPLPVLEKKAAFIFAADHGITEEGVSLYPKEVTYQMVLNFLAGGAGINVLSRHLGYDVSVVDTGVSGDFNDKRIINKKVAPGTANFHKEPAMTELQLKTAMDNGKALALSAKEKGYGLVSVGDMGIGNTSTAAAMLIAAGFRQEEIVDRGTGINETILEKKRRIIVESVEKHSPYKNPLDIMRTLGGFELCTMTGFILGLKTLGIACVIDGFPVSSAAYMAYLIDNSITDYVFAGHKSKVIGHITVLNKMGLKPIIDLNMRLGEGSGAVIGGFLVELGSRIMNEMASFESADVSRSETDEENY